MVSEFSLIKQNPDPTMAEVDNATRDLETAQCLLRAIILACEPIDDGEAIRAVAMAASQSLSNASDSLDKYVANLPAKKAA